MILPKSCPKPWPPCIRSRSPSAAHYTGLLKVMWPLVWLVNVLANSILKLLNVHPDTDGSISLNREELRSIVHTASGPHIPQSHLDMLISVLDLESYGRRCDDSTPAR
ncbi:MAG: hypothetical protein R3E89_12395 [Thiolinea sp.]